MNDFLDKFHFLKSRKFWSAFIAFFTVLGACLQVEPFPWPEFIEKTVQIASVYIGSVAFEDGMGKVMGVILGNGKTSTDTVIQNPDSVRITEK